MSKTLRTRQSERYVLIRNANAPTARQHALIVRAYTTGLSTVEIAEAIGKSLRQIQRLVKGQSH